MRGIARLALLTAACATTMGVLAVTAQEAAAPHYIGAAACGKCHKSATAGEQLGKWQASDHAQAYATLVTEAAAAVAKKAGIQGPAQAAPECLRCHVTAYGVDATLIDTGTEAKPGFQVADGVQCESCHGAGSEYKSRKVMKDQAAAVAAGLVIPTAATCTTCHNAESPTFTAFNFEEMAKKIAHAKPAAAE